MDLTPTGRSQSASTPARDDIAALRFVPIELSYVVPLYFDQQNHDALTTLLQRYASFDPLLLDRIQFVLVDDCSPVPVALPNNIDLNMLLLRICDNIPWNQGGARNLGVVYSRSDKVLATDLDHEFSEATLRHIVDLPPLRRRMYRLRRVTAAGEPTRPHPNTFVMSRGRFLQFHGVDEEFCGAYGSEDGMFWRWQRYNGTRFSYLPRRYANRQRVFDRDTSYHSLTRDNSRNYGLKRRKKLEWAQWGPHGGHSRQFLKFTWDIVEDRRRANPQWAPRVQRSWKRTWMLRWLFGP